jgi:hypothetical protein
LTTNLLFNLSTKPLSTVLYANTYMKGVATALKGAFSVVDLFSADIATPSMWVFAYKMIPSGTVERVKSRLVAKGCAQK